MTPTHATKGGKRYRYYVCSQAQKRGWNHCPSQSVSAGPMERTVLEQIAKIGHDPEHLGKILNEASKQRRSRLADLESDRHRLEREFRILTESFAQANGASDNGNQPVSGFETNQENIGHLERRLAENQEQALAFQQPALEVEQAAQALTALEQGFGVLPVIDQTRLILLMVQRVDYDGGQGKLALTLDPAGLVAVMQEQSKHDQETTK
jgi:site-specific DNA recombinase